jgi:hypothetical protein
MRKFKASPILACLIAIGIAAAGTDAMGQGKGRGGNGGGKVHHGNGGGPGNQGRERQVQRQSQQYVIQQNGGNDRRAEMQQRMQQIQQQRQQRVQQWQRNQGDDRRAEMQQRMQQIQQQRQQQIQQWQQSRGNDRRAEIRRSQQIQQQRQAQAQQWGQQYRGADRRAEMMQRMRKLRQQRELQMQQRIEPVQRYEHGRNAGRWSQRDRGNSRGSRERDRDLGPQIIPQPKAKDWLRRAERSGRRERLATAGFYPRQYGAVWPRNYGQLRREQVHQRNAERWRERDQYRNSLSGTRVFERGGSYAPSLSENEVYPNTYSRGYFYNDNYLQQSRQRYYTDRVDGYYGGDYAEPYYADSDYSRPRAEDIFRSVIFAVLNGGFTNQGQDYYDSSSTPYYEPYSSAYLGYEGSGYAPAYSYATDPAYYDPYFYEDPQYSEVLPMQYFLGDEPGSGLFKQMFTHLLAIGYEQGYQEGLAARRLRERDRIFYDPYSYDNVSFDPYSVSLGGNRRCLSEGYELGYDDAINQIGGYEQFDEGGVDLVSLLIGTVSQLI